MRLGWGPPVSDECSPHELDQDQPQWQRACQPRAARAQSSAAVT
nr:MAG TPA: hypothetical protein [Caudoviricetes sp.]